MICRTAGSDQNIVNIFKTVFRPIQLIKNTVPSFSNEFLQYHGLLSAVHKFLSA